MKIHRRWLCVLVALAAAIELVAAEPDSVTRPSVKELAAKVRDSIVVITFAGREGGQQGLGTGFVVDSKGLIATNLHVIGEARPIQVQTADGKSLAVKAIHASDRALDLAILEVDAKDLKPLELADSEQVQQGEAIVVMGNPQGLRHSVVSGVVSSRREIDGRKMLQLALPVEPGNSGGPVINEAGRVLGIVTMKSLVTENLGFAVEINALKTLLEKPNSVPIDRWLAIGGVDPADWTPLFGARWQQRGSKILAGGIGSGFGGRSLLLSKAEVPELPYELAVEVRLDDESGAAGLIFHADGGDKHYGFYPSGGKLRLSRFEGPDVFSWHVLAEEGSDAYKPGQWNRLKVRVESGKLQCFVNDKLVVESADGEWSKGRAGLAKFRTTEAEFRGFAMGKELPSLETDSEAAEKIDQLVKALPELATAKEETVAGLSSSGPALAEEALRRQAKQLEAKAEELKRYAADVRLHAVLEELKKLAGPDVKNIDLLAAALTIARLDEDDVDVAAYVKQVDRMAGEIKSKLPEDADEKARLAALNDYLFKQNGFHGSRTDYYHRANSYLSRVIDDREGLPITLSILYMELGGRLGLKMEGVGLPGHFVVRHLPAEGEPQLLDVFEEAEPLSRQQAEKKILEFTGQPATEEHFAAAAPRQILLRVLQNLLSIAQSRGEPDREAIQRYTSAMLVLDPALVRERGLRAVVRWETGRRDAALADLQTILDARPEGIDLAGLQRMQDFFRTTKPDAR